jgi:hypothetical protein
LRSAQRALQLLGEVSRGFQCTAAYKRAKICRMKTVARLTLRPLISAGTAVLNSPAMRKLAGLLILSLATVSTAHATLIVIIPAKGATVICADRRFVGTDHRQLDSDEKLQLLSPHALFFTVGLEAVSSDGKVLFAPEASLREFLAEEAAKGIPSDIALQNASKIAEYLKNAFEKFLSGNKFPPPKSMPFELQPGFVLGILRMDDHVPSLTVLKVSQEGNGPVTTGLVPIIEHFFSRSDPMYLGQLDVVQHIAEQDSRFSRFFTDPYVHEFILTNFGKPLTNPATVRAAARRLIAVTADGLKILSRPAATVSKESVCAVMDYLNETAQYR